MGKFATAHPEKSLTYSEAYALAQKGAKITHRYMAANEWMTVLPNGRICFEDGCEQTIVEFWLHVATKQDGQTVGAYLTKPNSEESARFTIR